MKQWYMILELVQEAQPGRQRAAARAAAGGGSQAGDQEYQYHHYDYSSVLQK